MQISNGKIVSFLQTLRTPERTHLVVKRTYRYNDKGDVPEITEAINGKSKGDKLTIHTLGFKGLKYNPMLKQQVPKKNIKDIQNLKIGACLIGNAKQGGYWAVVKEITDDYVLLDANHHLIGKDVYFDIEILSVEESEYEPSTQEAVGILVPYS